MPLLQRPGRPSLYYIVDDYTDPWAQKPWLVLQHGYSCTIASCAPTCAGSVNRLVRWYAGECGKANVDVLIALSRVAAKVNVEPYLDKVAVPTLALYPTAGTVMRFEEQKIQ